VEHLLAAYEVIRQFLTVNFKKDDQQVLAFMSAFTKRVKLIRIRTPNLTHALKVFETINDRGVGLNAMDLLKNLLFMKLNGQDYSKLKAQWEKLTHLLEGCQEKPLRFLRYFIMSHYTLDLTKGIREDQIYEWFQKNMHECGIQEDPLGFVEQLL